MSDILLLTGVFLYTDEMMSDQHVDSKSIIAPISLIFGQKTNTLEKAANVRANSKNFIYRAIPYVTGPTFDKIRIVFCLILPIPLCSQFRF